MGQRGEGAASMSSSILDAIREHYRWDLSLMALGAIIAITLLGRQLLMLVPEIRQASELNKEARAQRQSKPHYVANQKWNRPWALLFQAVIFLGILPFCITVAPQPWWNLLLDVFVILMFYDFFYYLSHRFLFHNNGFLGGPLIKMHAIHHQQMNPCRTDSGYLHPLETAIGLGLYIGSIFVLSLLMGRFHLATVIVTFVAFTQINLHNHDLWEVDRFPFKYLNYASKMHHNHHKRFTGGNYATISPLYDWMFGTLDNGQGWGPAAKAKAGGR
jgi:sterol desaturase/sphingolipid hydroxylase (fatty acid hydroxylase superfamily)